MDIDPTSQDYRDAKRLLFASVAGGEDALFLSKIEQHLPNAEFRLKHKLGISDASLDKLYARWQPELNEWLTEKRGGRKDTWLGFAAFKREIDLIKAVMLDFGYPAEVRQDIKIFAGNDAELRNQAIEETRFRAALQFWEKYFHRVIIEDDRAFYVIPPSSEVFDNNPVVTELGMREAIESLTHLQNAKDVSEARLSQLRTWLIVALVTLGLVLWIVFTVTTK